MDSNQVTKRIGQYWNRPEAVAAYDTYKGHGVHSDAETEAWMAALNQLLPVPPADVLDLGTGTGMLALIAARLGHRVVGVDLAPGMLDAARAKASDLPNPPRFELGDAIDPPFAPASFDAICNRHLLWTLSEPAAALANWFKLLRPGGRLIVIDGLWFANRRPGEDAVDDDDRRQFHQTYTPEIVEKLPAMHFTTVEQVADLLCECGYLSVEISGLADVERAEESVHGPLQEPPRFVVVGRKPD